MIGLMIRTPAHERRRLESLDQASLAQHQLTRFNALLAQILPANRFYADKLGPCVRALADLEELKSLPLTTKQELCGGAAAGTTAGNLTFPPDRYVRYHQTSGTRGRPLAVLDTLDDWAWWIDCWQYVLDAAEVTAGDHVLLAFSFGPFIGFWSAYEAAAERGCLVIPAGGLSSLARLELIGSMAATVLCSTPSYALHLADVAGEHELDLHKLGVRAIIVAGEPGGSVPATRGRIENAWNARVLDHAGATEVGPWGYGDLGGRGLHVLESEFIAEFLAVGSDRAAAEGELAELVLTSLGRVGCPVIRYRTGDVVRPVWDHGAARRFVLLDGGVLGRVDDMMVVRGVNIYPSAVEQIVRSFADVLEYRLTVRKCGAMDELSIEIEDRRQQPERVAEELRARLGLRVEVQAVPLGTLPRFEGKGRRLVDQRGGPADAADQRPQTAAARGEQP